MSQAHTCIKDDGGTPNRRCYACEAERKPQQMKLAAALDMELELVTRLVERMTPRDVAECRPELRALREAIDRFKEDL